MTVYVDDMQRAESVGRFRNRWSHLFADTHAELTSFAAQLGLNPGWIQHEGTPREHYDLTAPLRKRAIALGAVEISYLHETPALIIAKRHGQVFDLAGLRAGTWRPGDTTTPTKETPEP